MSSQRLEAFSDAVIAILITIMVLELKVPHGTGLNDIQPLLPTFMTYVMSFVYLAIYWNNHHHMLHVTDRVNGAILWSNMHLLFWLSLVPFVTRWLGENHLAPAPVLLYGVVLFMAGVAYYVLQSAIVRSQGPSSRLRQMIGRDLKGKSSPVLYLVAIGLAPVIGWASIAIYVFVALMWLVPDRRIERHVAN